MAKKKKPAANPARGYATTSITSKSKPKDPVESDTEAPEKADTSSSIAELNLPSQAKNGALPPTKKVELTPEELEAQLLRDELQLLVEKHAAKARRESRRHILKFQTDQRVLRSQAQHMSVHDWVPNRALDSMVSLAQAESNDSNRRLAHKPLLKVTTEEDTISRLWTLDLTFRGLGFSHDQIQPVLRWLCANAAVVDSTASMWGFQEGFEWLALNQSDGHPFSFEGTTSTNTAIADTPIGSRPETPVAVAVTDISQTLVPATSGRNSPTAVVSSETDVTDVAISDLDSDLEEDQLIETYLKIKERLFLIDPDVVDSKSKKLQKGSKSRNFKPPQPTHTAATRKLLSQLGQLESDVLFDQDEAEARWPDRRNLVAQARAAAKKDDAPTDIPASRNAIEKEKSVETDDQVNTVDEEDPDLLGDMFSAVPDETPKVIADTDSTSEEVTLRDFGKQSGLSPRRLLEEGVRARDPGARLIYKLISPTAYSCRHSLSITWSKPQDFTYELDIAGFEIITQKLQVTITALSIATVSIEQSEGLVSTAALFSLFASSTKEEKLHLRLPSNWRDLYREMMDVRKDRIDAEDRGTIQHLRSLIQDQVDDEESDGVVLTSRFKMRSQGATDTSTPTSGYSTPKVNSDTLRDIWQYKSSTAGYYHMLQARMNLPVFGFRATILSTIDKHQVTIICGETGCGKSTQIPSFILEHELSQGKPCKIFCTEPRRISAISLAQRVSEELGEGPKDIGTPRSLIGYAIRLETKSSAQTRLVYATVGVVLRMLESSRGLSELTHLVIDEVHERSIDTDFLLIVLRSLMLIRPELKVILMSATVDAQRFSKYLNDAPVINVPGRTYPVQVQYLEDAIELTHYTSSGNGVADAVTNDNEEDETVQEKSGIPAKLPGYSPATRTVLSNYDEYGIDYDLIVRLIEAVGFDAQLGRFSNAFLVFLPGIAEIRQLNELLSSHPSFDNSWLIYPLHSTISSEDQQAAFLIPPPGMRKIVIATNIAETGVTIPDITCVIDTGKHKEMRFDERRQLSRLTQSFVSRANAKQRRGRAGRVQEGICFHLFTKFRHDTMMTDQQTPEMLRLSLQDLVMRTKICKLGDIEKTLSEALDPPSSRNIRRAIDALIEVDALTSGEELTPLGRQIAKLPLDAHLGKLVLLSAMFGCVDVAITIAAIISSKSPFLTPFGAKQRADAARWAFKKGDSDLLTTYNAYKSWKAVCVTPGVSEMQYCHKNFLSPQNLGNIEDLKAQLLSSLVEAGFVQLSSDERRVLNQYRSTSRHRMFVLVPSQFDTHSENDILINSVIATAFYPKILIREGKGWRNIANNQTVSIGPTSVNKPSPINPISAKFLSYYHIMQSSNKYLNAHSTSIAYPLPLVVMAGADNMDFKLYAGVISLPGNVLRFSVSDWKIAVALKMLRKRVKEILSANWKSPGRQLSGRETEWLDLFFKIFVEKWDKEERIRERASGKGK